MEQQSNSQAPDLATVLRNLAALAPPPAQQPTGPSLEESQSSASPQALPDFGRHAVPAHPANHHQSSDPRLAGRSQKPASQNYSSVSTTPPGSPPPALVPQYSAPTPIDPATITEWAPGLRCITKIAAQNHNFKPIIQKVDCLVLVSACSANQHPLDDRGPARARADLVGRPPGAHEPKCKQGAAESL